MRKFITLHTTNIGTPDKTSPLIVFTDTISGIQEIEREDKKMGASVILDGNYGILVQETVGEIMKKIKMVEDA